MDCLLLADRTGCELDETWAKQGIALLPAAGKTVCEYAVEEVLRAGCERVYIAAGEAEGAIRKVVGDGARWGVSINYVAGKGSEHPAPLARRCAGLQQDFLVLRGDVLFSGVRDFVERAAAAPKSLLVVAQVEGVDIGLSLCRDMDWLEEMLWPYTEHSKNPEKIRAGVHRIAMSDIGYSGLESAAAFQRACLEVATGVFTNFSLDGWERAPGLRVGPGSFVDTPSIREVSGYIGRNCRIHEGAELSGRVVIGANSFVDRGARVEDSVIMPDTYVGENLELRQSLVSGNRLLRIDTGAQITLTDPFLLASMKRPVRPPFWRRARERAARLLRPLSSIRDQRSE